MNRHNLPSKVLITGGHEVGGVRSFAEGLSDGFAQIGIATEIVEPLKVLSRWRELRDPSVLKILSTTGVFAAPFARRAICMAHGVPRVYGRGWARFLSIIGTFKLANACQGAQLVAVSHYTAVHLQTIFNVRIDEVILNPLKAIFLESAPVGSRQRNYITFVGRLDPIKNLHRLLPVIRSLLDESPDLRACIIGDGEQRAMLEESVKDDRRFEFLGNVDSIGVRDRLRRTRLFVSGSPTEPLGIVFLEALSQGCAIAMPACGGGLEIALDQIGSQVHLFPITFEREQTLWALQRALRAKITDPQMAIYSALAVAKAYLEVDSRFQNGRYDGTYRPVSNAE